MSDVFLSGGTGYPIERYVSWTDTSSKFSFNISSVIPVLFQPFKALWQRCQKNVFFLSMSYKCGVYLYIYRVQGMLTRFFETLKNDT